MNLYKLTYTGALLALSMLVPFVFHFTGIPNAGAIFLPMHIPVLMGGLILGPVYGLVIGMLAPFLNSIFTGMPTMIRMPFMVIELGVYGLVIGVLYEKIKLSTRKYGVYIALILTMIIGRVVYALLMYVLLEWLHLPLTGTVAVFSAAVTGIYGMGVQLIVIPPILFLLKKGRLLDGLYRRSQKVNEESQ